MEGSPHAKTQLDSPIVVSIQCRLVTDRQTDGRTRDDSIYRASIASRGKKNSNNVVCDVLKRDSKVGVPEIAAVQKRPKSGQAVARPAQ